ncbi:helicase SRCAP isoform X2 [Ranitomeya imitator]|uniref:helicase SRCAP isoform X2 n=1 Tax=Ranitomeya imitator TaxID=111125 RepID=UPI0037E752C6
MEPCPRRHMPASDVLTSGIPPMSPDSSGELSPFDLSGDIGDICPGSPTDDGLDGNQQDSSAGQKWDNHTEIAEQAKHEAEIENRIAELRKEGFWTPRRLSKFPEPARPKVHWDYLCEEMQWLSADFGQERRWKRGVARKVVRMVVRHHEELKQKEERARRDEQAKLRRIATSIAKEVRQFWSNVEKVVQFKQQSRLEEKRKKALDLQLDFIVGQTEKYSDLLSQSLSETLPVSKTSSSCVGSSQEGSLRTSPTPSICQKADIDGDFLPLEIEAEEEDDEETIELEEQQEGNDAEAHRLELELLRQESELPLDELLQNLPPEILQDCSPLQDLVSSDEDIEEEVEQGKVEDDDDDEFTANEDDAEDEEDTIEAEEEMAGKQDHAEELSQLAREGEMSLEELLLKYSVLPSDQESTSPSERDSVGNEDYDSSDCHPSDCESEGVEFLVKQDEDDPGSDHLTHDPPEPKKEITDIAATAESLQPKGYTLATTQVKTAVPFLLRGELREYQHIGLEWLVTMYEKKLNGILADEMGLGKTIQTISLLAHLACERGNWGPHLIIVPTSVILNWEMELKRWCPSFKILTYYGSQKERKLKRQGWTKANAFHVCITSYKLVLQDHQAFRRKNWKYLILDEAQNIKNFKSQRWQSLLNFNSQRRLLLTGTPLQNSLMELWSLMHFLMPHVFQSHREFKEWFSNPLTGMIEGSQEYNEGLVRRLHKVLRPFLLRRIKLDVEKQMPKKYEHVVYCRLSKRQRFLYDDFMSQAATRETLASGHFMSVINILMQLRKVCNHPNLFDPRPIHSPFITSGICYTVPSLVLHALQRHPLEHMDMSLFDFINMEGRVSRYERDVFLPQYKQSRSLIQEIAESPEPPPRPRTLKMKVNRMLQPVKPDTRSVVVVNNSRLAQKSPDVLPSAAPQPAAPLLASSNCTPPLPPALKAPLPVQSCPAVTSVTPVSIGAVKSVPVQNAQPVCAAPQRLILTPEMQARLPSGEVISLAQLATLGGRPIQSQSITKPLTLQLQGAKLTLGGAPVRPLGVGQPRPLQGNVLHLVSSGGQHHLLSQPAQLALIQALAQQAASPAPPMPHLVQNTSQAQIGVQAMSLQSLQHTLVNSASLPAASPGQAPSPGVVKIVVRQTTRDVPASPLHHPVAPPVRPLLRVVPGPSAEQSTAREGPGEQRAAPVVSTSTLTLATSPLLMMSSPGLSTRLPSPHPAQPNIEESSVPPMSGVALRLLTTSAGVQLTNHHSSPPRHTQSPSLPNCCPTPIQNPSISSCSSTHIVCPDATPCPSRVGAQDPQSVQNGNGTAVQVSQPVTTPTSSADSALYVNLLTNPPSPPSANISKMTTATPTYNLSLVPALLANSGPSTVASSYPIPARFLTSPVSLLALSPLPSSNSGATSVLYTAPGATAFPAASVSASLPLLAAPVSFTAPLPVSSSTQSSLSVETPSQQPLTVVSNPSHIMPLSAAGSLPATTISSLSLSAPPPAAGPLLPQSAPPAAAAPLPLMSASATISLPVQSVPPAATAPLPLQFVPPAAPSPLPLQSVPPLTTAALPLQSVPLLTTAPFPLQSAPPRATAPLLSSPPPVATALLPMSAPPAGTATPFPLRSAPPSGAATPLPLRSAPPSGATTPFPLRSAPPSGATTPLPLRSAPPFGATTPLPLRSAASGAATPLPIWSAPPSGAATPLPGRSALPPAILEAAGSQPLVLSSDSASVPLREAFASDSLSSLKLSSAAPSSVPLLSASGTVPLLAAASAKMSIPMVNATSAPSTAGLQPSCLFSAPQTAPLPLLAGAGPSCVPGDPLSSHSILIPAPIALASMRHSAPGSCPPSSTPVPAVMTKMMTLPSVPAEAQTPLTAKAQVTLPPAPADAQVTLLPTLEAAGVSSVQPVISGFSQSALPCLSVRIPAPQPSLPVSAQPPSMPAPMPSMPASTPIPLPLLPASTPSPMSSLSASSLDPASLLLVPSPAPDLSSSVSACAQPVDSPSASLLPPPPAPHPLVISFSAPLTLAASSPSLAVSSHSHLPVLAASVLPPQSPSAALHAKPIPSCPGPVTAVESSVFPAAASITAASPTPDTQSTLPVNSLLPSSVQEPSLSLSVADPPTISMTLGPAAESDGTMEDERPLHGAVTSACVRPRRQLPPPPRSPFYLEPLEERRRRQKLERLDRIFHLNERRSSLAPIYGTEVLEACAVPLSSQQTDAFRRCTFTAEQRLEQLAPIIERFIFAMPPVEAPQITLHTSHPPPSLVLQESVFRDTLSQGLTPHTRCLHGIISNMRTQFPDLRLIQYDCGKLQTMDRLLRQLKSGGHRVLIFTQMTRMLDVLEQFLNYHGHIYVRLDGSTRVEQRQVLMERFNMDKRIFCFILSTRSGGVGVNLTGADTVIFYDSDWNPTMDAQAQDRCHRIGQTRDVHIYRLVSERTVEENILKKAQQKRLLGDMAIEGGNFTTAYFKQHTIRELFDMEDTSRKEVETRNASPDHNTEEGATSRQEHILEQALCGAEDEEDTLAASLVRAEQVADLAEFNENVPLEPEEEEQSRAEQEISALVEQLTPIERYAMYYLEASLEEVSKEELKQAEEQVEAARKDLFLAKDEVGLMTEEKWDDDSRRNRKVKTPVPNKPLERVGVRTSERLRGSRPIESLDHTENLTIPDTAPQSQEDEVVHDSSPPTRSNQATPEPDDASPSADISATQVLTMDPLSTTLPPIAFSEEETVPVRKEDAEVLVMENVADTGSVPGSPVSAVPGSPIPPRTPRRKVFADSEIMLAGASEDSPTAKVLRRLPGRLVTIVQEWLPSPRRQNRGRGCQIATGNDSENSTIPISHSSPHDRLSEETSETGSPPPKRKRGRPPKTRGDMSPTYFPIDMPPADSPAHTSLDLGTAFQRPTIDLVTSSVVVQTPGSPNSYLKTSCEIVSKSPIEKRKRGRPPKTYATPMSPHKLDSTPCVPLLASSKLHEEPPFASLVLPKKHEDSVGEPILVSPLFPHRDSTPEVHDRDTTRGTCSSVFARSKSDGQNESSLLSGQSPDSIIPSVSSNIPTVPAEGTSSSCAEEPMSPPKRKRGRPPKVRPVLQINSSPMLPITDSSPERSPRHQVTRTSLQRNCKPLKAEPLDPMEQNSYLADTDDSSDEEVTVSAPLTRNVRTRLQSTNQRPPVVIQNSVVSSKSSCGRSPHTIPIQEKLPTKKRKPQSVSSPSPSSSSPPHGSSSESRKRPCPPAERVLRSSLTANPASNTRSSRSPLLNSPSSHKGRKAKT